LNLGQPSRSCQTQLVIRADFVVMPTPVTDLVLPPGPTRRSNGDDSNPFPNRILGPLDDSRFPQPSRGNNPLLQGIPFRQARQFIWENRDEQR
jgi:hypothetical protein